MLDDDIMNDSPELQFDPVIHIRIQPSKGKKYITIIEGLNTLQLPMSIEELAKTLRKKFNCSSTIKKPENIIQMQGDHREGIKSFFIDSKLIKMENIKIHGF